jgi:hypothetical protein
MTFREALDQSGQYAFDLTWVPAIALSIYNEAYNEDDRRATTTLPDVAQEILTSFDGPVSDSNRAKLRALIEGKLEAERRLEDARARLIESQRRETADISDASDPRLAPLWEQAHEAATQAGYCGEFDRMMTEIGAPGRSRSWRVVVEAHVNAYVYVEAKSEDDAQERAEARFEEVLMAQDWNNGDNSDREHGDVQDFDITHTSVDDFEIYE